MFCGCLKTFGGWGGGAPRNPFAERIEKPVRKIGPPLIRKGFYIEYGQGKYDKARSKKTKEVKKF